MTETFRHQRWVSVDKFFEPHPNQLTRIEFIDGSVAERPWGSNMGAFVNWYGHGKFNCFVDGQFRKSLNLPKDLTWGVLKSTSGTVFTGRFVYDFARDAMVREGGAICLYKSNVADWHPLTLTETQIRELDKFYDA